MGQDFFAGKVNLLARLETAQLRLTGLVEIVGQHPGFSQSTAKGAKAVVFHEQGIDFRILDGFGNQSLFLTVVRDPVPGMPADAADKGSCLLRERDKSHFQAGHGHGGRCMQMNNRPDIGSLLVDGLVNNIGSNIPGALYEVLGPNVVKHEASGGNQETSVRQKNRDVVPDQLVHSKLAGDSVGFAQLAPHAFFLESQDSPLLEGVLDLIGNVFHEFFADVGSIGGKMRSNSAIPQIPQIVVRRQWLWISSVQNGMPDKSLLEGAKHAGSLHDLSAGHIDENCGSFHHRKGGIIDEASGRFRQRNHRNNHVARADKVSNPDVVHLVGALLEAAPNVTWNMIDKLAILGEGTNSLGGFNSNSSHSNKPNLTAIEVNAVRIPGKIP
mmetsp:Transcript_20268/g.50407  ORF Transcript_20268/g.50407 Transcript_20268/m.50407 type:complete len:384 (+) Transcript_20268:226-1377(+)